MGVKLDIGGKICGELKSILGELPRTNSIESDCIEDSADHIRLDLDMESSMARMEELKSAPVEFRWVRGVMVGLVPVDEKSDITAFWFWGGVTIILELLCDLERPRDMAEFLLPETTMVSLDPGTERTFFSLRRVPVGLMLV